MAFKKLVIKLKGSHGARGTRAADEMMDMLRNNWDLIQEKYNDQSESEKNDMLEHFNAEFENMGEFLFGDDANVDDLAGYIDGFDEENKEKFCSIVEEALQFEQ